MLLNEDGVVRAPGHLSDEEAATLPCAALTAWNAIYEQGKVSSDDTVLIQGTGGVALFALQFAVQLGANVIATSKSDAKLERAKDLGAAYTINYVKTPEWSRSAKNLTDGRGVDHVVDLGGSATIRQSIRAVRSGGFISMIGVLGGPVAKLDLPLVVMRNVRLQGVTVGSRNSFERMVDFMETNQVHPVVDRVFDFEDAPEAFEYMEQGKHFGKVCIKIDT
jgi:NADPH:quinone reductase-like Zn-dependent oxidoreductase